MAKAIIPIIMKNRDLQLIADILIQNKSKTGEKINKGLFGKPYGEQMIIDPKAFKILTKKDREILKNPKYFPLYYGGEMIRTDYIYNKFVKKKLEKVI